MQKENNFIEYKQFNVVFGLNRLTILSTVFPQTMDSFNKKTILKFYSTIDDGKWHCWEKHKKNYNFGDNKAKKKSEKQKSRQSRKYKKDRGNIIKIFQKMKKFLKEVMVTIEIKIWQTLARKKEKNIQKIKIIKEKNCWII